MLPLITNLLLIFLLVNNVGFSQQRSIPGRCKKEFLDPVNAAKAGYCWKFNPHSLQEKDAATYCKQLGGHLVTVDSKPKSKLLGQFITDSLDLTAKDYFGKNIGRTYRKLMGHKYGYKPWVTISSVYSTRSKTTWTGTGKEVGWEAYADRKSRKHSPGHKRCPAFTLMVNKWIYMKNCKYYYPFVCEQDHGRSSKHKAGSVTRSPITTTTTLRPTTTSTKSTTTKTTTKPPTTTTTNPPTTTTKAKSVNQKTKDYNYYPNYYYYYDDYYYYK